MYDARERRVLLSSDYPASLYPTGDGPERVVLVDLDADGLLDAIVSNTSGDSLSILQGTTRQRFIEHSTIDLGADSEPFGLAVSDLDGDGMLDILVTERGNDRLRLLQGAGGFAFTLGATLDAGTAPVGVVATDLDRDGDDDVVVSSPTDGTVRIFENSGGTLTPDLTLGADLGASTIVTGRFDDDAFTDFAVVNAASADGPVSGPSYGVPVVFSVARTSPAWFTKNVRLPDCW